MSDTPFLPLWVADFLAKTTELDAAETGAYLLLLMAQWSRKGRSLPDDPRKLQRVARCGREWSRVWAAIAHYFDRDEDGIFNHRLRFEAQKVASKREVNAQNGARGGAAKALKQKKSWLANATNSLQQSEPEPYPVEENKFSSTAMEAAERYVRRQARSMDSDEGGGNIVPLPERLENDG